MTAVWITTSWDDGHILDFRVAELLRRNNLRGTFYIPRRAPTGVMDESRIRELADSFEIGGHTLDHLFLADIPDAQAASQISDCRQWLQDLTGRPCTMFCPPAGRYVPAHVRMMRDAGFHGFRTVELLSTAPPSESHGLLRMPTTLQVYPHRRAAYLRNLVKRRSWRNLTSWLLHGPGDDWEPLLDRMLDRVLRRGGVFHLWGHSWEIERAGMWKRLEQVLERMGRFTSRAPAVDNGTLCRQAADVPAMS